MNFKAKLAHYLSKSQEENIISEEQKQQILELIEKESSHLGFMKIVSIIGAICIGIGVILIIASNWSEFPHFIQLILSLLLPVVTLGAGYYFSYIHRELQIIGNALIFLGGVFLGATITLIGQIYNTDGTLGSLTLIWFVLVLPLVFVFRMKTLAVLACFLFYSTVGYYLNEVFFRSWRELHLVLVSFVIISGSISIGSYIANRALQDRYRYLLFPVMMISIKIMILCLFIPTIEDSNTLFFGKSFFSFLIHNLVFIVTVMGLMWWSHKNHEILLRYYSFLAIGIYITAKYLELFSGYLQAGVFFIVTGIFIIGLVYAFIKINGYLNRKQTQDL